MMMPVPRRPSVPVPFFAPDRPACVVVIDRDRGWADGLSRVLGQDLFEVHAGYGWPDLERLVDTQSPTVVVVELGEDIERGLAAIGRLRAGHPSGSLHIVATRIDARPADIAAALRAGCDLCLARPASFEALREIVREAAR
jgi:DNA-binding NarL/FixJ family response regulator